MMRFRFDWQFPGDHPSLSGHFPGEPIAPGAVLLDRLVICARQIPQIEGQLLVIKQAKFLQTCAPDDRLQFVLEARLDGAWAFHIERAAGVLVEGVLAAQDASTV